jgi:hypothetical protein
MGGILPVYAGDCYCDFPSPAKAARCGRNYTNLQIDQCETMVKLAQSLHVGNWLTQWQNNRSPCWWSPTPDGNNSNSCIDNGQDTSSMIEIRLNGYLLVGGFQGTIPDLSALTQLKKLYIHGGVITGPIPDFSLPNLQIMDFADNQLIGPVPNLSTLTNLILCHFGTEGTSSIHNQLSGSVRDFSGLPNLKWISFSGNQLTSSIPELKNRGMHLTPVATTYSMANYGRLPERFTGI